MTEQPDMYNEKRKATLFTPLTKKHSKSGKQLEKTLLFVYF